MSLPPNTRIVHLIDVPDAKPVLAQWFVDQWEPHYGTTGPGDARADLDACAHRDRLPLCLVALNGGRGVMGTAALKADSVGSDLAPGPWLAALLVGAQFRGQGVGTALIAAIEAEARQLGFPALYVSTDTAEGLLRRRGWTPIGTSQSLRGAVVVFKKALSGR